MISVVLLSGKSYNFENVLFFQDLFLLIQEELIKDEPDITIYDYKLVYQYYDDTVIIEYDPNILEDIPISVTTFQLVIIEIIPKFKYNLNDTLNYIPKTDSDLCKYYVNNPDNNIFPLLIKICTKLINNYNTYFIEIYDKSNILYSKFYAHRISKKRLDEDYYDDRYDEIDYYSEDFDDNNVYLLYDLININFTQEIAYSKKNFELKIKEITDFNERKHTKFIPSYSFTL